MLRAFSTVPNRNRTFILLAASVLLALAAVWVGIDDNPPGLLLAFLSATSLVLAFVHPWRSAQPFRRLIYASGIAFIVFGILHNVFDALASLDGGSGLADGLLIGASIVCFFIAILLCPPALLVGAVGAVTMSMRNKGKKV